MDFGRGCFGRLTGTFPLACLGVNGVGKWLLVLVALVVLGLVGLVIGLQVTGRLIPLVLAVVVVSWVVSVAVGAAKEL